jgi:hypothetical protein
MKTRSFARLVSTTHSPGVAAVALACFIASAVSGCARLEPGQMSLSSPSAQSATGSGPESGVPRGVYRYGATTSGHRSEYSLVASRAKKTPYGLSQVLTTRSGPAVTVDYAIWNAKMRLQERVVTTLGEGKTDCDWQPDLVLYKFPLSRGNRWSQTISCSGAVAAPFVQRMDVMTEVVGVDRSTVAARVFVVWVIRVVQSFTSDRQGPPPFRIERVERFAPSLGLVVSSVETRSALQQKTTTESRLLSLRN